MTFITLSTIFPLMSAAGFDLIWFGVVYTITMEIAVLDNYGDSNRINYGDSNRINRLV